MNTTEIINNHLALLGSLSPDEIAARLLSEGCFGERNSATSCPIHVYLCRQLGGCQAGLRVYTDKVRLPDDFTKKIQLPVSVEHFISYFDGHRYGALRSETDI